MLDLLQHNSIYLIFCCTLLGLVVGSFLNVVIHRLPIIWDKQSRTNLLEYLEEYREERLTNTADKATLQQSERIIGNMQPPVNSPYTLAVPRSACPHCGHKISALENLPIISYLCLRGKCRGCQRKISPRYPLVEFLSGVLCGLLAYKFGYSIELAMGMLATWLLISMAFIDADTFLLPHSLTLPFLWLGIAINWYVSQTQIPSSVFLGLSASVLGAVVGFLILWSISSLYKLIKGYHGMGEGDFPLLAGLCAWGGWQIMPSILLYSALVGLILTVILKCAQGLKTQWTTKLPFGPYLAIAGWVAIFYRDLLPSFSFVIPQ